MIYIDDGMNAVNWRSVSMAKKRNAQGSGNIRQRSDGTWEARFTFKDELGQSKRKSIYGKTQAEVRKKMTAALKQVDEGSFTQEKRYTVEQWLDVWISTYCNGLKPSTVTGYKSKIRSRIVPNIGNVQLSALTNVQVQKFYNKLESGYGKNKPLSAKSIQNIHGILHKSLEQAVFARIIPSNPCDHIKLPKLKKPELKPIMDDDVTRFLDAIKGDPYERIFIVDLFSGLRQSEILGLQWEDIDFENGEITVRRQLQKDYGGSGYLYIDDTKNGKQRVAVVAPTIVKVLRSQRVQQMEWKLAAGSAWNNDKNLVFTNEYGNHLAHITVYKHFKKIVKSIGLDSARFHDLRHSYAVNALQAGDNIKSIQEQLGHYSSAFTMDTYAAVSNTMRKQSQEKMEKLIQMVSDL